MLDELYVENLGIISTARIEPGPGLVAVTGETGTGKTLLLGALRLLRGEAARADRVGPHGDEARVEGRFGIEGAETVVSRRIGARSRAYLDGEMVSVKVLAEKLDDLVEVVAQHEHVSLGRDSSIRSMVDGLLDDEGQESLATYRSAWQRLTDLRRERDAAGGDPLQIARDLDVASHQLAEILGARLLPNEDDELKQRLTRSRNSEGIAAGLTRAASAVDDDGGATDRARSGLAALREVAELDPELASLSTQLGSAIAELDDLAAGLRSVLEGIEHDPATLQAMEERAAVLADLKRKYGVTIDEVIAFGGSLETRVATLQRAVERATTIASEIAAAETDTLAAGALLTAARQRAATALTATAEGLLKELGFRAPTLSIELASIQPASHGCDRATLLFASDSSLTPGPAARVASGGELSRLVLALRVAAGVADADVVAFDEIDAGVGGTTALAVGELLARLAVGRQVLVVTHLPQIAAFADAHFVVDRTDASATVRRVEGTDRLAELTRMLGGLGESEQGRLHAAELLEAAGERRRGA